MAGGGSIVVDLFDVLVVLGLLLVGLALWMTWGPVAVLAYAGTVLIVAGLAGAISNKDKNKNDNNSQFRA